MRVAQEGQMGDICFQELEGAEGLGFGLPTNMHWYFMGEVYQFLTMNRRFLRHGRLSQSQEVVLHLDIDPRIRFLILCDSGSEISEVMWGECPALMLTVKGRHILLVFDLFASNDKRGALAVVLADAPSSTVH